MQRRLSGKRELLALLLLFCIFLAGVYHFQQAGNEAVPRNTPGSLNAKPVGAKALYLLLGRLGYRVDRLEAGWRSLRDGDGLAIIIEPLIPERRPTIEEIIALKNWIEKGGTVLYCVTEPPRPLDPLDPLAGDLAIVNGASGSNTIAPPANSSPYLRNIHRITVNCPVRLQPAEHAGYEILAEDQAGAVIVHKTLGRGHLIAVADLDLTSNSAILQEDNAQFMVNVAASAIDGTGKNILFDEYHHGAGFEGNQGGGDDSLLANTPVPIKLALLPLIALTGLLVYTSRYRFGAIRSASLPVRPVHTDYIRSMARLYRRSQSADIALLTLAAGFRRDLTHRLDLPLNAPVDRIVSLVQSRYAIDAQPLGTLLQRCAQVDAGERIAEPELLALTRNLQEWQRRLQLVGV